MSPVPPGERAKALLLVWEIILRTQSHSSRVILPSLFASRLSKASFKSLFWASALDTKPSLSRAYAPRTAHILPGRLISSRAGPYDSPGTTRSTEENHGRSFPHLPHPAPRSVNPPLLHQTEGSPAGTPPL